MVKYCIFSLVQRIRYKINECPMTHQCMWELHFRTRYTAPPEGRQTFENTYTQIMKLFFFFFFHTSSKLEHVASWKCQMIGNVTRWNLVCYSTVDSLMSSNTSRDCPDIFSFPGDVIYKEMFCVPRDVDLTNFNAEVFKCYTGIFDNSSMIGICESII